MTKASERDALLSLKSRYRRIRELGLPNVLRDIDDSYNRLDQLKKDREKYIQDLNDIEEIWYSMTNDPLYEETDNAEQK